MIISSQAKKKEERINSYYKERKKEKKHANAYNQILNLTDLIQGLDLLCPEFRSR